MHRGKSKLSKRALIAIISGAVAILIAATILVLNAFVPIKYFSAFTVHGAPSPKGVMRVSFIDVSFGDCALIEFPDGKTALIDSGNGDYKSTLSILEFLNEREVEEIDYLVCTSVKKEHCGGFAEILKYKKVKCAYVPHCTYTRITPQYHSLCSSLERQGAELKIACVGEGVSEREQGYFFSFLSPVNYLSPDSEYAAMNKEPTEGKIDNASAVLWVEFDGVSFAFTSDIRPDGFKRILTEYEFCKLVGQPFCAVEGRDVKLEDCDVVTVTGHGGEDNVYAPWYDLTKPSAAVVSVGKNYSGFPSAEAMTTACNSAEAYYTLYDGNVIFNVTEGGYTVQKEKE